LRLQYIAKRHIRIQLGSFTSWSAFVKVYIVLSIVSLSAPALGPELGVKSPDSQVFLERHAITPLAWKRLVGRWYL
jgi:hypothetical protein